MLKKIELNKKDNSLNFRPITEGNIVSEMEENVIFHNTDSEKIYVAKNGLLVEINKNNNRLLFDALLFMTTKKRGTKFN